MSEQPIPASLRDLTVPIASLKHYSKNPRQGDVGAIMESLRVNGQYRPVVVNRRTDEVLAGNHTLKAARELGWSEIAATFVDVDDEAAARIALVDNRANDLAAYDDHALLELITSLPDLQGTGFDGDDLDDLIQSLSDGDSGEQIDEGVSVPDNPVTKPGDLWQLGDHLLLCGDCRDSADVGRLVASREIAVAFTSPPYADRRVYDESSGFRPIAPDDYVDWFEPVQANVAQHLADDGSWFVNIKPSVTPDGLDTELYVLDLVLAHARQWGWHFATEFCWERNGVPKRVVRRFKNQFEPVYQFTRADWKMRPEAVRHHSENVPLALGEGSGNSNWGDVAGRGSALVAHKRQSNLVGGEGGVDQDANRTEQRAIAEGMAYPGNRLPTFASTHEATGHSAAFPVGLPQFFIQAFSDTEDVVFDPFVGSGSTLLAAENTGRIGLGMELSPAYCDVTVERWERHSGRKAEKLDG